MEDGCSSSTDSSVPALVLDCTVIGTILVSSNGSVVAVVVVMLLVICSGESSIMGNVP